METISCDFCGSDKFEKVTSQTDILHKTTKDFFNIVECSQCKLNFLNPRPTPHEIGAYYAGEYSFHQFNSKLKSFLSLILDYIANSFFAYLFIFFPRKIQKMLAQRIRPKIQDPILENIKSSSGKNVLDIGCGSGINAHFWGASGSLVNYKNYANAYGVEVEQNSRKHLANHDIKAFASLEELEKYSLEHKLKFDFIRMNWSLEHVHSPTKYFDSMKKLLKDDGTILIAVPHYDGFLYRMARDLVEVPIHLFHFKLKDIENYAQKFGLKIIGHQTFSYPGFLMYAGEVYSPFRQFSELSLLEALSLKKFLDKLDQMEMGNDIIIQLRKNQVK